MSSHETERVAPPVVAWLKSDSDRCRNATPVNVGIFDLMDALDGSSRALDWRPVSFRFWEDESALPIGDFVWAAYNVVLVNARARDCLREELVGCGELLPATIEELPDAPFWIWHVTRLVAGAWCPATSDIVRFSSGRVMDVRRLTFRAEVTAFETAFRCAEFPSRVYATSHLVWKIASHGLTGTKPVPCEAHHTSAQVRSPERPQ